MAIPLRADFDGVAVRSWAKKSKGGPQARRLLAPKAIYEGASRTEAAKIGGVTLQIVRDWVLKFNADGPAGLIDRKAPGQPPRLNEAHRVALAGPCHRNWIWLTDGARCSAWTSAPPRPRRSGPSSWAS